MKTSFSEEKSKRVQLPAAWTPECDVASSCWKSRIGNTTKHACVCVCVCEYVCLFLDVLLFILVGWPMSISCNGVRLRCQSERALIWKSERDGEMVAREMRRIRSRKRKSWKNVWMEKMSERTRCEEEDRKEAIHTGACSSCATMTPAAGPPVTSLSSLSGCSQWELVTPVFQASH